MSDALSVALTRVFGRRRRVTPELVYPALYEALPHCLPTGFPWSCECGIAGLPGCSNLEHFCTRVYLAIVDHHQAEETLARGLFRHEKQAQAIRVERFSPERKRLYEQDVTTALMLLKRHGVRL